MANDFAITAAERAVDLRDRRGRVSFTVANATESAHRVIAVVRPEEPADAAWFTVEPPVERALDVHGADTWTVDVAVPEEAEPGSYAFRLRVHTVEGDPEEVWSDGPSVAVEVPEPPAATGADRSRWWILAAAGAAVVVVAVLLWVAFAGDGDDGGETAGGGSELPVADTVVLEAGGSLDLDTGAVTPPEGSIVLPPDAVAELEDQVAAQARALRQPNGFDVTIPTITTTTIITTLTTPTTIETTTTTERDDPPAPSPGPDDDVVYNVLPSARLLETTTAGLTVVSGSETAQDQACAAAEPTAERVSTEELAELGADEAVCVFTGDDNRSVLTARSGTLDGAEVLLIEFRTFAPAGE